MNRKQKFVFIMAIGLSLSACSNKNTIESTSTQVTSVPSPTTEVKANNVKIIETDNNDKALKDLQEKTLSLVKAEKYDEAEQFVMDSKQMDDPTLNALRRYGLALKNNGNIQEQKTQLAWIPNDYSGLYAAEINNLKNTVPKALKEEYSKLAKAGDQKLIDMLFFNHEDPELNALFIYVQVVAAENSNNLKENLTSDLLLSLRGISDDYSGVLAAEVKKIKIKYKDKITQANEDKISLDKYLKEKSKEYEPKIGMTKEKVLDSTWGKPQDINKTESTSGTHEQWVYSSNKYLYFDDDKLTTIQS